MMGACWTSNSTPWHSSGRMPPSHDARGDDLLLLAIGLAERGSGALRDGSEPAIRRACDAHVVGA